MPISFAMRISPSPQIMTQEIEGEYVFLDMRHERYFSLNPIGARTWQVLTGAPSIEAAYQALLEEYEVAPARLRSDLQSFVEELAEHGLVEIHDG